MASEASHHVQSSSEKKYEDGFREAIWACDVATVREMIATEPVNHVYPVTEDFSESTALSVALRSPDHELQETLGIVLRDGSGGTLLYAAISKHDAHQKCSAFVAKMSKQYTIIKMLIDRGSTPSADNALRRHNHVAAMMMGGWRGYPSSARRTRYYSRKLA